MAFQSVADFINALQGARADTPNILATAALANQQATANDPDNSSSAPVGGSAASPTAPVKVNGNVDQWTKAALSKLGLDYNQYGAGVEQLIQHESGGNPNAINLNDSNAKAGHPSQGLTQTIPGTFQEYALPGYNKNIDDPVSNIIAGVRYAKANYGLGMLAAGGRHDANGNYLGY